MEPHKFDGIVRRLSRTLSRRSLVVGGFAAAVLTAAEWDEDVRAKKAKQEDCLATGKRCGGKRHRPCRKCCQRYSITLSGGGKKCACRPDGQGCSNAAQCCSGNCQSNVCRGSSPPTPPSPPCLNSGASCTANTQCCSFFCGDGVCEPVACSLVGQACTPPGNCCSGICTVGLFTFLCRSMSCVGVDQPCGNDVECCEGLCSTTLGDDSPGVCVSCGCPE